MPAGSQADFLAEDAQTGFVFDGLTGDGVYARYRNENAVPMGFTYDYYVLPETVETVSKEKRGNLYLRPSASVRSRPRSMARTWSPCPRLSPAASRMRATCRTAPTGAPVPAAALRPRGTASPPPSRWKRTIWSFSPVPYDEGFAATVNGEAAEVLNVDGGLIAIPAKAGENEITLTLTPKWLPLSCGLTAAGALLYAGYLTLTLLRRHRQGPLPGPLLCRWRWPPAIPAPSGTARRRANSCCWRRTRPRAEKTAPRRPRRPRNPQEKASDPHGFCQNAGGRI